MNSHQSTLETLSSRLKVHQRETLSLPDFRRAAVMVPLLDSPEGLQLLFTVRSSQLSNHAGQISFPGGRLDNGETIEEAACRETCEEVGLCAADMALLGRLDDHPSPAGYVATPVVALLAWPQKLRVNPDEVEEVFTVPLSELAELTPWSEERQLRDFRRHIHFYSWRERLIWGLTANVLKNFLDILTEA